MTKQTDARAKVLGTLQTRELRIDSRAIDEAARTVELAFSSEAPVERWWGREILDHGAKAVRLGRMRDGAPLLLDHRTGQQIGVIESARIDADRVGRALVRFSRGPLGEEIFQDVRDGIRSKVSVGYMIHEMVLESSKDGEDTYRITDWEPIESSIVSIPADPTVGVGRSFTPAQPESPMDKDEIDTQSGDDLTRTAPEPKTPVAPAAAPVAVSPDAEAIRAIGAHFGLRDLAEDQIMLGCTLDDFRALVRKTAAARIEPIPTEPMQRIEARIAYAGQLRAFDPARFGNRQTAEEAAYRAGQFYRAQLFNDQRAARWCRDHGVSLATRTLDGSGAGQAAIVPDELAATIISLKEKYGIAMQVCDVVPMTSDSRTIAIDTDEIVAQWVGAGVAADPSDPGFDYITLNAKRLRAKTVIDNDYADDSIIDLAEHVADKQARAFAIAEDSALFNGDGTSTYGGIVGIRTKILGLAGAIDAATDHDTFAEIAATDLRKVMAGLPDIPGIMPSWYCSKIAQEAVFGTLMDAAGGNTKRDLATGEQRQYAGYPIVTSPAMPKVLTDLSNVVMIVFGDLRLGVKLGQRKQIEMAVNPYALMDQGQTQILSFERIDINCHGVGDANTAGPIVALVGE